MSATVIYVQEGVDGWGDGDVVEIGDCAERSGLKPNRPRGSGKANRP